MKKTVAILGGNALNAGVAEIFRQQGYRIAVLDFRSEIGFEADMHLQLDATAPASADILNNAYTLDLHGVYTSMDDAGLAQKSICEKNGLLCADADALLRAHNKALMHERWENCDLLGRISYSTSCFEPLTLTRLNTSLRIILKPVDSCASRGISVMPANSDIHALEQAFFHAKEASATGAVNVEEYVEGQEFTVEMLGDNYGNVCVYGISKKYHTLNAGNNRIAVKLHYNPADVSPSVLQQIADKGRACYKALALKNVFGHLEIIRKANGELTPIELGARSSGFIASHLADAAVEEKYLCGLINVQHGGRVVDTFLPQRDFSAMYYFYDIPCGRESVKTTNITEYLPSGISSKYWNRDNIIRGRSFAPITQDTDRYGYEILVGKQGLLTIEEVQKAERAFLYEFFTPETERERC